MSFITEPLSKLTEWAVHPSKKHVFGFHEGTADDKELLGNKGANLCEMSRLGLPVPPGIIISTEACIEHFEEKKLELSSHLIDEYTRGVISLEKKTKMHFGGQIRDGNKIAYVKEVFPLLLSVRSGASVSMPGMMDTVLNLGINDYNVLIIENLTYGKFAYDIYRRFLQMFGDVVLNVDKEKYEKILEAKRTERGVMSDSELTYEDMKVIVQEFKKLAEVPQDPWEQLQMAIKAVFKSWYNPRAVKYRDINGISSTLGTAVTIQSMVYGNFNDRSGSGVCFTRDPATGENKFYGEYLSFAEGEDVVAGIRTPMTLDDLQNQMPTVYSNLVTIEKSLERHYRDVQDIEFTVQNGALYILQTRSGKRSPRAAIRVAVSMVMENLITEREALLRLDAEQMNMFLYSMIDTNFTNPEKNAVRVISKGLAASGGAIVGNIVFTCEAAIASKKSGASVILCREMTTPDDIGGLNAADGVLTSRGGLTSHAAIVMRNMGKSSVVGARNIQIDVANKVIRWGEKLSLELREGATITLDGTTGLIYFGEMPTIRSSQDEDFRTILRWAEKYKRMEVMANADTPEDCKTAQYLRANGIGLVRTEHMFFKPERINMMRSFILSESVEHRCQCLAKMLPMQQEDFAGIIRSYAGKQVTIRLLDPPLHEFLPSSNAPNFHEEVVDLASRIGMDPNECEKRVRELHECNPMMGFRGCRLSILYPELTDMQTRAIIGAAVTLFQEGISCRLQIMIPLVCSDHEIECIVPVIKTAAESVCNSSGCFVDYKIGAMLEVPRAMLRADSIAKEDDVSFLSIGTNDLTQLIYGFSRDDVGRFLPAYMDKHIFASDPFKTIDQRGVGSMISLAIARIRKANSKIKIGVCGEHAGDAESIDFFEKLGVDYISCSPFRLPVAKVAAAQATIRASQRKSSAQVLDDFWNTTNLWI